MDISKCNIKNVNNSFKINPEVKYSGIHFLGIGHSFIKFPKNVQMVDFSKDRYADRPPLKSRTFDGLEVILEISFQFE